MQFHLKSLRLKFFDAWDLDLNHSVNDYLSIYVYHIWYIWYIYNIIYTYDIYIWYIYIYMIYIYDIYIYMIYIYMIYIYIYIWYIYIWYIYIYMIYMWYIYIYIWYICDIYIWYIYMIYIYMIYIYIWYIYIYDIYIYTEYAYVCLKFWWFPDNLSPVTQQIGVISVGFIPTPQPASAWRPNRFVDHASDYLGSSGRPRNMAPAGWFGDWKICIWGVQCTLW